MGRRRSEIPLRPVVRPARGLLRRLVFARWIPSGLRRRLARRAVVWTEDRREGDPFTFTSRLAGLEYRGTLRSHLDAAVYFHGAFEKPLACFLRDAAQGLRSGPRFREGGVPLHFWDVGANVGQHSLVVSRHVDAVEAFEPFDEVADLLEGHVTRNRLGNVRLHRVALGETSERRGLLSPTTGNRGTAALAAEVEGAEPFAGPASQVLVRSGDEVAAELFPLGRDHAVGLIKIDVEGWERQVLAGLAETLGASRPVVVMEVSYAGPHAFRARTELLEALPPDYVLLRFDTRKADGTKARRRQARARRTGAYRLVACDGWRSDSQDDLVACPSELMASLPREGRGGLG